MSGKIISTETEKGLNSMAIYDAGKASGSGRKRTDVEIFTPKSIVNDMLDMLLENDPDVFLPCKTFLEPSCGEGAFVIEILRRKFENCKSKNDFKVAIASVYGMDIQADNIQATIGNVIELCNEYFKPSKEDLQVINDHYIQCDSLKVMKLLTEDNRLNVYSLNQN
jgi:hypothetical protein